jgi:hypothetical protein
MKDMTAMPPVYTTLQQGAGAGAATAALADPDETVGPV